MRTETLERPPPSIGTQPPDESSLVITCALTRTKESFLFGTSKQSRRNENRSSLSSSTTTTSKTVLFKDLISISLLLLFAYEADKSAKVPFNNFKKITHTGGTSFVRFSRRLLLSGYFPSLDFGLCCRTRLFDITRVVYSFIYRSVSRISRMPKGNYRPEGVRGGGRA